MPHADYLLPWPRRSLRCVLSLHSWQLVPGWWRWKRCRLCGAEKQA